MNVITHALAPALLAAPVLAGTTRCRRDFYRAAGVVAIAGALPDLVNPHLSLAARYASWSHTIFALAGFGVILVLVRSRAPERLSWVLATLAWLAFALHLFGDAVSGGIAPLQPLAAVVVRPPVRWIPHRWWWWMDGASVLVALATVAALSRRFGRHVGAQRSG